MRNNKTNNTPKRKLTLSVEFISVDYAKFKLLYNYRKIRKKIRKQAGIDYLPFLYTCSSSFLLNFSPTYQARFYL